MRIVGREIPPAISNEPSVANLVVADRFMAMLRGLAGGPRHYFPKGVYRYASHEEADEALIDAVARDMAQLAHERTHGAGKVRP